MKLMPQWRLAIWTTPLSATPRSTASRKHDRHAARCCCSPSRSPIKYGRLEGSCRWNPRDLVDCRSRGDLPGVSLRHAIAYAGRMDEIQRAASSTRRPIWAARRRTRRPPTIVSFRTRTWQVRIRRQLFAVSKASHTAATFQARQDTLFGR